VSIRREFLDFDPTCSGELGSILLLLIPARDILFPRVLERKKDILEAELWPLISSSSTAFPLLSIFKYRLLFRAQVRGVRNDYALLSSAPPNSFPATVDFDGLFFIVFYFLRKRRIRYCNLSSWISIMRYDFFKLPGS